jgi:uncharacterized protein YkwD
LTVRITRTSLVCALFASLAIALPAVTTASTSVSARASASAKNGVNALRARTGHRPLRTSPSLDRSASAYAHTMLRRHYFGHASNIRASHRFRALGEALAMQPGRRPRAGLVVSMWARSPEHRSILTSGQFRKIGIGTATGRFHGRRVTMWVAQVGR